MGQSTVGLPADIKKACCLGADFIENERQLVKFHQGCLPYVEGQGKTSVDWLNFIRDIRTPGGIIFQLNGFDNNGDPTVEIDESYFFHRKYNHGQFMNGMWVFKTIE